MGVRIGPDPSSSPAPQAAPPVGLPSLHPCPALFLLPSPNSKKHCLNPALLELAQTCLTACDSPGPMQTTCVSPRTILDFAFRYRSSISPLQESVFLHSLPSARKHSLNFYFYKFSFFLCHLYLQSHCHLQSLCITIIVGTGVLFLLSLHRDKPVWFLPRF